MVYVLVQGGCKAHSGGLDFDVRVLYQTSDNFFAKLIVVNISFLVFTKNVLASVSLFAKIIMFCPCYVFSTHLAQYF